MAFDFCNEMEIDLLLIKGTRARSWAATNTGNDKALQSDRVNL